MTVTTMDYVGTVLFACAVLHTFLVYLIKKYSHKFSRQSLFYEFLHLLSDVELVFAFWAVLLFGSFVVIEGNQAAINYFQSLNFTEPIFVFCIMALAATYPIRIFASHLMQSISTGLHRIFRFKQVHADVMILLSVGTLSGSFITEPAAITIVGLMLNSMIRSSSEKLMYGILAFLFVNISIGGAITPYAAPPILMVAKHWNWDFNFMLTHFAWKVIGACFVNAAVFVLFFYKAIDEHFMTIKESSKNINPSPAWLSVVHYGLLGAMVYYSHYTNVVVGIFFVFMAVKLITKHFQKPLRLKESLMVALFLGGIIIFGGLQQWWLKPLLAQMDDLVLYVGATLLTSVTDNAALTYLGSQVEGLSDSAKYYLVAGAIAGGGLTIIANAPNAAGFSILSHRFRNGLNPIKLLIYAAFPTAVAVFFLGFFN
jgi:hypothetical protein